jgi:hypothetical protein
MRAGTESRQIKPRLGPQEEVSIGPNNLQLLSTTRTALISILKCRSFDYLVRSEVVPLSAPRKSPNNRHPQAPIRHPDLERVARNLSEAPGARPGLTHIVGPLCPTGRPVYWQPCTDLLPRGQHSLYTYPQARQSQFCTDPNSRGRSLCPGEAGRVVALKNSPNGYQGAHTLHRQKNWLTAHSTSAFRDHHLFNSNHVSVSRRHLRSQ